MIDPFVALCRRVAARADFDRRIGALPTRADDRDSCDHRHDAGCVCYWRQWRCSTRRCNGGCREPCPCNAADIVQSSRPSISRLSGPQSGGRRGGKRRVCRRPRNEKSSLHAVAVHHRRHSGGRTLSPIYGISPWSDRIVPLSISSNTTRYPQRSSARLTTRAEFVLPPYSQ